MRTIFFDLDGTLLNEDHQLHPENIEVIHQLQQRGVTVCLASGRTYQSMRPFHRQLGLQTPLICYNGAKIVFSESETIETALTPQMLRPLVELSRDHQFHLHLYRDEEWYTERPDSEESRDYAEKTHMTPIAVDLYEIANSPCTKALFIAAPERLAMLSTLITAQLGDEVDLTSSMNHFLEVLVKGINKGWDIRQVCERLALPLEQTIAFGDGLNDLEMLQLVGHGVAMENAHETLKVAADAMAPHHAHAGVARYLRGHYQLT